MSLAANVKAKVMATLDERQKEEFERNIKRLESRHKRDRRQHVRRRIGALEEPGSHSWD